MARMTRTQKYAELRQQLANDREETIKNETLEKFEEKLKNFESQIKKEEEVIEPVKETSFMDDIPTLEDLKIEEEKEEEKLDENFDFLGSLDNDDIDKTINDLINQKIEILDEEEPQEIKTSPTLQDIFKEANPVKEEIEDVVNVVPEATVEEEKEALPVKEDIEEELSESLNFTQEDKINDVEIVSNENIELPYKETIETNNEIIDDNSETEEKLDVEEKLPEELNITQEDKANDVEIVSNENIESPSKETIEENNEVLDDNFKTEEKEDLQFEPIDIESILEELKGPVDDENSGINEIVDEIKIGVNKELNDVENKEVQELESTNESESPKEEKLEEIVEAIDSNNEELNDDIKPVEEAKEEVEEYVRKEEPYNVVNDDYISLANKLNTINEELNGQAQPVKEEEIVETVQQSSEETATLKVEETKDEELTQEASNIELIKPSTMLEELKSEVESHIQEKEENKEEEIADTDLDSLFADLEDLDDNSKIEDAFKEIEVNQVEKTSVEDALKALSIDEDDSNKKLVDETKNDELTIEPIKEDIVEAIEEVKEEPIEDVQDIKEEINIEEATQEPTIEETKEEVVKENDELFTNTVSLQIDKVLNEMSVNTASIDVADVISEVVKQEEVKPEEFAQKMADTISHPVLAKVLEEDVVEIKSLDETLKNDVVDDTIPFDINEAKKEEEIEYIEDEKPNKILNAILIFLIIVLVIILLVILYYVLYAKGIIG